MIRKTNLLDLGRRLRDSFKSLRDLIRSARRRLNGYSPEIARSLDLGANAILGFAYLAKTDDTTLLGIGHIMAALALLVILDVMVRGRRRAKANLDLLDRLGS